MKWVLSCASGYYSIGDFDGSRFLPEIQRLPAPAGPRVNIGGAVAPVFYGAQTFSNHPEGLRVQIGWGVVDAAESPFTQMMSLPTTLSLKTTSEGIRLCREPVSAIQTLRTHTYDFPAGVLRRSPMLAELKGTAWDIEAVIKVGSIFSPVLMSIGGDEYAYQPSSQIFSGPKGSMLIPLSDERLRLRILVDRTTVEVFGAQGQAYGLFIRTNPGGFAQLALRAIWDEGDVRVEKLSAHLLKSAWSTP
jgi:sucrose-6-phosphate hydrolase SacC (GH32 family)